MVFSNRNPDAIKTAKINTIVEIIFLPFLNFKLNISLSPHGVSGYLKLNLESYCRFHYLSLFTFSVILVNLFS